MVSFAVKSFKFDSGLIYLFYLYVYLPWNSLKNITVNLCQGNILLCSHLLGPHVAMSYV